MTWTVKAEGNDLYYPEMELASDDKIAVLYTSLQHLYTLLSNVDITMPAALYNLCPNEIAYVMPSGLRIIIFVKNNNAFTLQDFTLPAVARTEKIVEWGLWPMPTTRLHFNLYPWQSWWTNYTAFIKPLDVVIKTNCPFISINGNITRDYLLSDMLLDVAAIALVATIMTFIAKYGFTFGRDILNSYFSTTQLAQNAITDGKIDILDTNTDEVLVRVKRLYAGSYV